jgi:hypothetical protein
MPTHFLVQTGRVAILLSATLALPVAAQSTSCALTSDRPSRSTFGRDAANLPVDRVADLLALLPGVSAQTRGELNVRAAGEGANTVYLDGVPVVPGRRNHLSPSLGGSYAGEVGAGLALGTNGFSELRLGSNATRAETGNAVGGIIELRTTPCDDASRRWVQAGVASDAWLGADNGIGLNRLTLNGEATAGRLQFGIAGFAEGQRTTLLGLDQNASPIYLLDGVDTTVAYNDGTTDRSVEISRFRPSDGIRIPTSASTIYSLSGHLGYQIGSAHRLQLTALTSQRQNRAFDYQNLYNSRQAFADRSWSQVVTGGWFGRLAEREGLRLSAEAQLSLQWDHETNGPLGAAGERDTRDPSSGLMLSPLDFRFDRSNFAVDDALIDNFRTNSGRRSPYDLDNTSQYQPVDEFRNNAYGLLGWSESGGPVGQLTLYDERRVIGKGAVTAEFGVRHRLRAGIETTRYKVDFYSSALTSQSGADAYRESPRLTSGFADYDLTLGEAELHAGVRLDHFSSGASRPDFPRISSAPGFDPTNPTAGFIADKSHSQLSPRVSGEFQASPRARLFAGVSAVAQAPDFTDLFQGINTDLAVTSSAQVYGTDLGFVHGTVMEAGATYQLDSNLTVGGALWTRRDRDIVVTRLRSETDPLVGSPQDIRRLVNSGSARATGIDLQVSRTFGARGRAWLSYSYVSADSLVRGGLRNHNAAAAVLYQTGDLRALGGALRDVGVYGVARVASGTAYTRCGGGLVEESAVVSDTVRCDIYVGTFNSARTPTIYNLDLRLTRSVELGSASLVIFGDIRNLLNTRNVLRVFAQSGRTVNPLDKARFRGGALENYANEGAENGVRGTDGTLDLTFGGAPDPRAACGLWTAGGVTRVPNCIYLIEAEERFGDGDHRFTTAEQTRAFDAYYQTAKGEQNFTAPGRRVRLGLEVHF